MSHRSFALWWINFSLSLFRTDFYAPFECCGCVTLQESGGGGDKAEDVVHEQQGLPQEGAGRRRQGDPGVRLWRPGLDVCSWHAAAHRGRSLTNRRPRCAAVVCFSSQSSAAPLVRFVKNMLYKIQQAKLGFVGYRKHTSAADLCQISKELWVWW